jgi:hypothetical protein
MEPQDPLERMDLRRRVTAERSQYSTPEREESTHLLHRNATRWADELKELGAISESSPGPSEGGGITSPAESTLSTDSVRMSSSTKKRVEDFKSAMAQKYGQDMSRDGHRDVTRSYRQRRSQIVQMSRDSGANGSLGGSLDDRSVHSEEDEQSIQSKETEKETETENDSAKDEVSPSREPTKSKERSKGKSFFRRKKDKEDKDKSSKESVGESGAPPPPPPMPVEVEEKVVQKRKGLMDEIKKFFRGRPKKVEIKEDVVSDESAKKAKEKDRKKASEDRKGMRESMRQKRKAAYKDDFLHDTMEDVKFRRRFALKKIGLFSSYLEKSRSQSIAVLQITIRSARDVLAMDRSGTSDPYCIARLGEQVYQTQIVPRTLNPVWEESFEFIVLKPEHNVHHHRPDALATSHAQSSSITASSGLDPPISPGGMDQPFDENVLVIDCYDNDRIGTDDYLGYVKIDVRSKESCKFDRWYPLCMGDIQSEERGDIRVQIKYDLMEDIRVSTMLSAEKKVVHQLSDDDRMALKGLDFRHRTTPGHSHLMSIAGGGVSMKENEDEFPTLDPAGHGEGTSGPRRGSADRSGRRSATISVKHRGDFLFEDDVVSENAKDDVHAIKSGTGSEKLAAPTVKEKSSLPLRQVPLHGATTGVFQTAAARWGSPRSHSVAASLVDYLSVRPDTQHFIPQSLLSALCVGSFSRVVEDEKKKKEEWKEDSVKQSMELVRKGYLDRSEKDIIGHDVEKVRRSVQDMTRVHETQEAETGRKIDSLHEEIEGINQKMSHMQSRIENRLIELEMRVDRMWAKVEKVDGRVVETTKEKNILKSQVKDHHNDLANARIQIQKSQARISSLEVGQKSQFMEWLFFVLSYVISGIGYVIATVGFAWMRMKSLFFLVLGWMTGKEYATKDVAMDEKLREMESYFMNLGKDMKREARKHLNIGKHSRPRSSSTNPDVDEPVDGGEKGDEGGEGDRGAEDVLSSAAERNVSGQTREKGKENDPMGEDGGGESWESGQENPMKKKHPPESAGAPTHTLSDADLHGSGSFEDMFGHGLSDMHARLLAGNILDDT